MRLLLLLLFAQPSLFIPLPGNPTPQPSPAQTPVLHANPGQPLPPGTVTYQNTWNQTHAQQCAYPHLQKEPLSPRPSNWTIVVNIPALLFMGKPSSSYVKHTYTFYANGTFLAQDDSGNSFAVKSLMGLPGTAVTTLRSNSTSALQNFLWVVGRLPIANVTVSYSVRRQLCQPAGLEVAINGYVNWRFGRAGSLSLRFDRLPVRLDAHRAWFGGNDSRVQLGFDWGDSLPYAPSFDRTLNALSWRVGPTFTIDPYTVATVSNSQAILSDWENTFYASGRYWAFWCDPSYPAYYASSADGRTWQPPTQIGFCSSSYYGMAATFDGKYLYYAYADYFTRNIYFRRGIPNSDGSVAWSSSQQTVAGGYGPSEVHIAVDTGGHSWITYVSTSNAYVVKDANTDGTWVTAPGFPYDGIHLMNMGVMEDCTLQPLLNSKMAVFCGGGGSSLIYGSLYDSGWQPTQTFNFGYAIGGGDSGFQTSAVGDVAYIVFLAYNTPSLFWTTFSAPTKAFGPPYFLGTSCTRCPPSVVLDPSTNNLLAYWSTGSNIYYYSRFNGASWSPPAAAVSLGSSQACGCEFETSSIAWSGQVEMLFLTGSSSPYSVSFAALPAAVPDATYSSSPWSKAGLSPYETYFSHFSDYVSPGNGLVAVETGTLDLPGRGLDLAPSLVFSQPYAFYSDGSPFQYESYNGANLGNGWALNFPWLGTYYVHLSDGQAIPYSWSGDTFTHHGTTDFVLTQNSGTYTLTMPSGTVYQFDSSKRLSSITDRTGKNVVSFTYGSNSYVSKVTDTVGRAVTFSYNAYNQLTSIASGGRTWTLGYTGNQLSSLTDPLSRVTSFRYVATSGAGAWLLASVVWPTGGRVTYAYGSAPVGTEVSTYYATSRNVYYDSTNLSLSLSQSIGYSLVNGQVTWSNSTLSDGTAIRSHLDYNFQNSKNLMKTYARDGAGALQRVTEVDSDAAGRTNETKTTSPSGTVLAHSLSLYDDWGNLVYSKDDLGQQQAWFSYANTNSANTFGSSGCTASFYTQSIPSSIHDLMVGSCDFQNGSGSPQQQAYYEYDSNGNLLEEKALHSGGWLYADHTYDQYGNALSAKNPNGYTTYFRYSSAYSSTYLTKRSALAGTQNVTANYTYDLPTGNLLSTTDPNGFVTSYSHDLLGRTTGVTYPAVGGISASKVYLYDDTNNILTVVDENGNSVRQYFDGLGRQTRVERWNGTSAYSVETYTYNWLGGVATKATAAGSTYTYTYDSSGRLTRATNPDATYQMTSYDDVNNVKTVTDENGHQKMFTYDWNNRLTSVKEYNSSMAYFLTSYSYDQVGNLLSFIDARNQVTSYQYDDLNRLTKTTFPDSSYETRTYDSAGNLLTRTDARGNQTSYTYDALNKLNKVTYPNNSTVTYSYDANGNSLTMVDPSSTSYYTYDARNRLTNETEIIGGAKYSTLYAFDRAGNVVSIQYPDSFLLSLTYDAMNRVKKVGSFATVAYTVDDKMRAIIFGNGEVTNYSYDSRGRPTRILDHIGTTKNLDLNYTYDGTGNVLTLNTESYSYDSLDRLTSTTGPWGTITYAYDQVGNRVKMVQGATATTYAYGRFNRLLNAGSTIYAYDANGNMVTKNDGFSWTFAYDYDNRLTKVVHDGTTVLQNVYDGDGKRIQKTEGDSTVFTYLGLNVLFEKDLNTGVATKRFYANGLQVAEMVGSALSYVHEDHLGSIRFVSTSTGGQVFSTNYVPYGPQYGSSGTPDEFMFAGKIYDGSTGFYYFGGRFYDAAIGRFITQDSSPGVREDPQSFDRYAYARDNPLKIVDPNGHDWWSGLVSTVTSFASAATNAWNSLPPPLQTVIVVAAVSVAVVATCGAAAPAILAGAAIMGGLNAGISVASNVVQSQPIDVNNALASFSAGFVLGGIAMVTEGDPSKVEIGQKGELDAQKLLANAGIETEQGWRAYPEGGGSRGVQLDLVDLKGQQFFDAKVGQRGAGYWVETVDIDHQAALLNEPVTIKNHAAGLEISGFTFRAGTWLNLKNSADVGGFSKPLKDYLGKNNMDWAYLY